MSHFYRVAHRETLKRIFILALVVGLISACATTRKPTLYDDLGGKPGVARLVDKLIEKYRADSRINGLFNETSFEYFGDRLNEYICLIADGGCEYTGLSMEDAHSGMDIKESEFNYFVEDSQAAMTEVGISVGVQNRLLKVLARDHGDVIRH
jgi:hemoglobin